ncbi:MAG: type II toxin-antitoxin system HicA family toxin [Dyadobacter sp.]
MSKINKLVIRFLSKPKDLTWDELVLVLNFYGYTEIAAGKTAGSRRKFSDENKFIITLHKPHPKMIVKTYVIDQLIIILKENRKI